MNRRTLLAIPMGIILVALLIVSFIYKDVLFMNKVEITYPNGCKEVFINQELTTEECTLGRQLMEEQNNKRNNIPTWNLSNFTI
jgi:hypothetical protein